MPRPARVLPCQSLLRPLVVVLVLSLLNSVSSSLPRLSPWRDPYPDPLLASHLSPSPALCSPFLVAPLISPSSTCSSPSSSSSSLLYVISPRRALGPDVSRSYSRQLQSFPLLILRTYNYPHDGHTVYVSPECRYEDVTWKIRRRYKDSGLPHAPLATKDPGPNAFTSPIGSPETHGLSRPRDQPLPHSENAKHHHACKSPSL